MKNYDFKDIDPEDIEDFLKEVETSLNIKFIGDELVNLHDWDSLCNHIISKVKLKKSEDCSHQQAFYKLRQAISSSLEINRDKIIPSRLLSELFPKHDRRLKIRAIENHLGFKLNILRPHQGATTILYFITLISFIGIFFYPLIGVASFLLSIIGFKIIYKMANEFKVETLEEVTRKMVRENYLKSRRDPNTFNEKEIKTILTHWFLDEFHLYQNKKATLSE